tara:strand:- start:5541 stop:5945 length:405 start_codon:yes stop_codon:yes gene_type:complete
MGWFSKTFHKLRHKVKKVNWADLADKGKKGWSVGTQILGYARKANSKLKQVAEIAALVPGLSEYALPVVAGLETSGRVLSTIDKGRLAIEKEFPSIVRNSTPSKSRPEGALGKSKTTIQPSVAIPTSGGVTIGD